MPTLLTKSLLVLLVVSTITRGQSRSVEQSTILQERTKRALALLEEIVEETRALKLPENRIRVDMTMLDFLWSRDEKRARSLFKDAVAALGEVTAATRSEDPDSANMAHLPGQLRQEMLNVLSRHDPKMALDFLRATKPGSAGQQSSYEQTAEAQLEMSVAVELALRDPVEALKIGEDALKQGLDYSAMSLLTRLQSKDRPIAQKFLGSMINKIRTEDFSKQGISGYMLMELLRNWVDSNKNRSIQAAADTPSNNQPAILDDQAARELSRILIKTLLDDSAGALAFQRFSRGQLSEIVQQLVRLLPDLASAGRFGALHKRLAEFEKIGNLFQDGHMVRYQKPVAQKTVEDLLEAAKTAPPELADSLLQNAVWKALNQGDEVLAKEIAERISNPRQRADMAQSLDRHLATQAGQRGEITKARTLLVGIQSMEERARLLTQLAVNATSSGDKALARELLGEAEGLLGNRALNYSQLGTQLQIARAYWRVDPDKSAAIVETAIERLNELATAASVLNGFDIQQYFRAGELVFNYGSPLNASMQALAGELGFLASLDLVRARSLAERFERREMRLMALLQIAAAAPPDNN